MRMTISAFIGLVLASLTQLVIGDQLCSLLDHTVTGDNLFNYQSFDTSLPIITVGSAAIENSKLRLTVDETHGGVIGYAWHSQRERIADGFVSIVTFTVPAKANPGDGFTYFIQNDKIVDLNGGTGDKLGSFGIARSIGVKIDFCVDRPVSCNNHQMSLVLTDGSFNNVPVPSPTTIPIPNIVDGQVHTLKVVYQGRLFANPILSVDLDTIHLEANVGNLASSTFFNDRFAFFGFTASTSYLQTCEIDILSWRTDIVPSDSRVDKFDQNKPFTFDFNTTATFTVVRRNSCAQDIHVDDNATIVSTLEQQPLVGQDPFDAIKLVGNVTDNHDGTYTVSYILPDQLVAVWDLDIQANGVRAENMPAIGGVLTQRPLPAGFSLPTWALILLLLLILLIILVLSYVVYRLYRYRKKLQQNAEFIEAGKKQAELDRLEDGVAYSTNKMVGTIDDLKAQLAKNEEELDMLRRRGALGDDQNFTIEQLQKQRDNLLEEMNRLKREEQEEELKRNKAAEPVNTIGRNKKEFGKDQI